jgi:hypothetical protein
MPSFFMYFVHNCITIWFIFNPQNRTPQQRRTNSNDYATTIFQSGLVGCHRWAEPNPLTQHSRHVSPSGQTGNKKMRIYHCAAFPVAIHQLVSHHVMGPLDHRGSDVQLLFNQIDETIMRTRRQPLNKPMLVQGVMIFVGMAWILLYLANPTWVVNWNTRYYYCCTGTTRIPK